MPAPTLSTYADRLSEAMGEMRASDLASKLGVTYQAVKKVLDQNSKGFGVANHFKAADILNVSPRWLGTGEGKKYQGDLMIGWPLSPDVLAALQNASPETRMTVENVTRSLLHLPQAPAKETPSAAA